MLLPPPRSTLFPYTTLFRSRGERHQLWAHRYHPVRTRLLDEGNVHDRETEREVPWLDEVHAVHDVVAHLLVAVSHDHEVRSRCRERDAREPERGVFGAYARRVVRRGLVATAMDQQDLESDAGER